MLPSKLILLRHGTTDWSRDLRHTGRTDVALNAFGREQASALRGRLPLEGVTAVWCSPLSRAIDTAALAGLDVSRVEPDLMEWDYGAAEGRTTADIRTEVPGWDVWVDGVTCLGGGGETVEEVGIRADRVIEAANRLDGTIVLVAHAHVLRVLAARWVTMPAVFGRRLHLEPASWSLLAHQREATVISRWNVSA